MLGNGASGGTAIRSEGYLYAVDQNRVFDFSVYLPTPTIK